MLASVPDAGLEDVQWVRKLRLPKRRKQRRRVNMSVPIEMG